MSITFITPHQRASSGGVYTIHQFARFASLLTEVHLVVAKGKPEPVEGVHVHGPQSLARLQLPESDVLLIPADLREAESLVDLDPGYGIPMLLFQGYGTIKDEVIERNLTLVEHAICVSTWLEEAARASGCAATLVRHGLDRSVFTAGEATDNREPVVSMMTHPREPKGTADGLQALALARGELPDLQIRLFGTTDPGFEGAAFLPSPNRGTEVAALMRSSSVFVCASWQEGLGLPGIEAISSGAALATTDTRGSRDYAFHARTALVTPPREPEQLARSIVDLVRDAQLRRRLIEDGQRHLEATYPAWERAAEALVVAVDEAAAAATPRWVRRGGESSAPTLRDVDDDASLVSLRLASREARRAKLMLREAEVERNWLEAELGRRLREGSDARLRSHELVAELERERDAHAETAMQRAALEARLDPLIARVADADERVAALTLTVRRSESELTLTHDQLETAQAALEQRQRQLEAALTARRELETELQAVNHELSSELDTARATMHDALAAEASVRRELNQLRAELELAGVQRERLQESVARARADEQVAAAERAAFKQQLTELSALVEREGAGAPPERNPDDELDPADMEAALAAMERLPSAVDVWPALPDGEREGQETFLNEYRELVAQMPGLQTDRRDPVALPVAIDLRGILAPEGAEQEPGSPTVDVVVCVHNALEDVRLCLWSLLHKTTRRLRLIVVNDGSDDATTDFLSEMARTVPALTLIHRAEPPHGYTIAANLGLRASTSDYVVMLNSDTVVSPGWLERILEYGEQHEHVGILGPLSNAASHQSVPERRSDGGWATNPLPGWLTPDGMALVVQRAAPRTETRLPFLNGFCFAIKRAVISAIGEFDEEHFAVGYAEENDYAHRARAAGFELAVVDDAYVYHAKSRSYGTTGRNEVARRAYQVLREKHGPAAIDEPVRTMEAQTTLDPVRAAVAETIVDPAATERAIARSGDRPLSVVFILPGLGDGGSGGSHSVYQEVHGLRRLGVTARIALHERAWDRAVAAYPDAEDIFEPYSAADDLLDRSADANVIIATHFKSVATLAALRALRDDFLPAYYVQDYEPMFTFADLADNQEAAASYTAVDGALLFAKTHWLCNVVSRRHGVFVAKVEPSIDDQLYRPSGERAPSGPVRIAAMVRPRTPRRQPHSTVAVLERVLDRFPGAVEVTTFGCHQPQLDAITRSDTLRASHRGVLMRAEVADLLGGSDVFLDMSTYQAFGRTALEAMACGATAIVPRLGGVWDFAADGENVLAIDTMDRDAAFNAVATLVDDRDRLRQLKAGARQTASRYSILRAALSEYIVLSGAYERHLSRTPVS